MRWEGKKGGGAAPTCHDVAQDDEGGAQHVDAAQVGEDGGEHGGHAALAHERRNVRRLARNVDEELQGGLQQLVVFEVGKYRRLLENNRGQGGEQMKAIGTGSRDLTKMTAVPFSLTITCVRPSFRPRKSVL